MLVLNKDNNLCPVNIPGELYIGGDGVAGGYLNNPELTAERFDKYRSYRANRTYINYKTGDLARWLDNGNIEFLGRIDQQVKIRGFRIELGEIENCLLTHPEIKEAVVIANEEGTGGQKEYNLCAYVVAARELKTSELREYLSAKLPDYMIPAYFVRLSKMPLTPNGKLDTKALPEHETKKGDGYIAPRDAIEEKLTEIWSGILGIDKGLISMDASFFELGGHSLKANVLISKIHKELNARVPLTEIFLKPTIMELANYLKNTAESAFVFIEQVEKKEYYKLSPAQERLYILQQMDTVSTAYNLPIILRLEGRVNNEILENTFRRLIERHESLRTSFEFFGDEPVQRIHENVEFEIEILGDGRQGAGGLWSPEMIKNFVRPFDLSRAPLLRVGLIRAEGNSFELIVDMHHIITDGASQLILRDEFNKLYYHKGEGLPGLKFQYRDYSEWQNNETQRALLLKQGAYWKRAFADEFPVLMLPTDYVRPAVQSFAGNIVEFVLSGEESLTSKALAKEANTTLFMTILAVFNVLLSKLSSQEDIIVGTPVMGRPHADLERIIGMFVNTLPLRNQPCGEKRFKLFLSELKDRTLEAYENQEYPFEDLVENVSGKRDRDPGRNPVFDVMINLITREEYAGEIGAKEVIHEANLNDYMHKGGTAKFDMTLTVIDMGGSIFLIFEYCTKLFKPSTIDRFIAYFRRILQLLAAAPDPVLSELEIINEEEKRRILFDFNNTEKGYHKGKTIPQLFEEQVEKTPDHVGLVGDVGHVRPVGPVRLTYRQLNAQSGGLAGLLIEKGVLADDILGIMMERSIDLIIGILGILKA
ncbi:MAG: hypothetical protein QG657_3570, partial [Acidobacteriota bacterium]|nr:hypothetical protein [Acidobacteriota bacterium]